MEIAATGLPGLGVQTGGATTGDTGAFAAVLGTLGGTHASQAQPALAPVAPGAAAAAKTPLLASAAVVQTFPVDAESLVTPSGTVPLASEEALPGLAADKADPVLPAPAAPELTIAMPKGEPKATIKAVDGEPPDPILASPAKSEQAAVLIAAAEAPVEIAVATIDAASSEKPEELQAEPTADALVMPQPPVDILKSQVAAAPAGADQPNTGEVSETQVEGQRSQPVLAEAGADTATASDGQADADGEAFARMVPGATSERAQPQPGANTPLQNHAPAQQVAASAQPVAPVPAAPSEPHPTLSFRADKVAREMGLEIARHVTAGGDELVIRLDPAELGRINIRMSVNEQGQLRAVVAADAPSVIEAIRNDIPELSRALEQAGVRTDSQSFRFDRGGSDGGGQWQQRYQQQHAGTRPGETGGFAGADDEIAYRPMATNGRINMMA